jgi:hypothetical protein
MVRWLVGLLLLGLALPAAARERAEVRITVTRAEGGDWLVDYVFARKSPVWFYQRSSTDLQSQPWRPQSFTVETPGVRMVRAGQYDMLTAGGAPLTKVRIRMRPFAQPLIGDYSPALTFSDGGVALYTDQLTLVPAASQAAVAALPLDLNGLDLDQPRIALRFIDPRRRMLLGGKAFTGHAAVPIGDDDGTYVYSGDAPVIETEAFAGVIDSGLPAWIHGELDSFTPQLFRLYTQRLGAPAGSKPMALVGWQGGEKPGFSLGGSVLKGMLVMQISGKQVLTVNPRALDAMRWFIGHESAHFWLGQTIHYERRADSWIMEGGADVLAVRAFRTLSPRYDPLVKLQQELDECLTRIGPGVSLASAESGEQFHAHYACGALMLLVAEAVEKKHGGDAFDFIRALIAAKRADGTVTTDEWLATFTAAGGDSASAVAMRDFVTKGVPDPRGFWLRLFDAAGVGYRMDGIRIMLT